MVRGLIQRTRFRIDPALSFVPLPRAPPNGCWPTTAPVGAVRSARTLGLNCSQRSRAGPTIHLAYEPLSISKAIPPCGVTW
jgi:hypothetical protein